MFSVVATKSKRNSKQLLTVVPSLWVEGKSIYWPPASLVTLSSDPGSAPDKKSWKKSKAKVLGKADTHSEAEILLFDLQNQTESEWTEDTEAAGASKPKKGRFESKAYTLEEAKDLQNQPVPVQPILITEIKEGDSGSSFLSSQSSAVPPEGSVPVIIQAGGQIVHLEDGSIAQIISNGGDSAECQLTNTPCCDVSVLARRLDQIELKIEQMEHIPTKMDTMLHFAADVHKFLTVRSKTEPQPRSDEDFSECEKVSIKEKADLLELEGRIGDFEFAAKMLRYYESVFNLSGKRDGKEFFRKFMRQIMPPSILIGYSWTGQTRMKKEGDLPNESFQATFPNFIRFVRKLMIKADFKSTDESTNSTFADFLRQKKTEIRRFGPKSPAVEKVVNGHPEHESSSDDEDFPGIETNME